LTRRVKIAAKIKKARTALGISQSELARLSGYTSRSSINKIELGLVDLPHSKLLAISSALGISLNELIDDSPKSRSAIKGTSAANKLPYENSLYEKTPIYKTALDEKTPLYEKKSPYRKKASFEKIPVYEKRVPLLGTIACGIPIFAEENVEDYILCPEKTNADFCLYCKGDSMIGARINDGDIVYIKSQPDVSNGEIAAVLIDDEATLKRVYKYPGKLVLKPENSEYQPLVFIDDELSKIKILGKAISFLSNVK
jgi:repressor LexA